MNPLVILVPVLVVLAIVVVVASARRRDSGDAIGALARETVNKDRGEPSVLGQTNAPAAGKEIEMAAVAARTGSAEVATRDSVADLAPFVQRLIAERRFLTESDVLAEGLRLLQSQEALRTAVRKGFAAVSVVVGGQYPEAGEQVYRHQPAPSRWRWVIGHGLPLTWESSNTTSRARP